MNSPQEFERLYSGVRHLEATSFARAAALATITRTLGSTFRRAGTSMLVNDDGSVVCALSGGCPQRDIVARALRVIENGAPEIARYNRESGLDVLMEMGCGGELEVLIEPLSRAGDTQFLDAIANSQTRRVAGFVATAFARDESVLSPRPQRLVWTSTIEWNDVVDAELANMIVSIGIDLVAHARAIVRSLQTANGTTDVLFEALRPAHTLVAIGINEGSLALARTSAGLGWRVMLIDHLDPSEEPKDLPANVKIIRATPESLRQVVSLDRFTSVVVMTFNVERDIAFLNALADADVAYLGAIASRERAARMRSAVGIPDARLHAPAGLDVGSETPEEIALAVSAEILANVNARTGGKLNGSSGSIHS
jgi:xanthine/CO dehydrogenase XdhC/CoxF family maturation factor